MISNDASAAGGTTLVATPALKVPHVNRGRPKMSNPKQLLSLRLPPEVIASWRASGPGWQTRMAELLEKASPKAGKRAG